MKELRTISTMFILMLVIGGCYYDVEEEIYPTLECDTADMSYLNDILPILEKDCYACHSAAANFGNVTIEGYESLVSFANDGSLLGVIKHESGYSPMPKNLAQLLDCEIAKIEEWINDGALNN